MPTHTTGDYFKPPKPVIPGVPEDEPEKKPEEKNKPEAAVKPPQRPAPQLPPRPAPPEDKNSRVIAIGICLGAILCVAMAVVFWKLHTSAPLTDLPTASATPDAVAELALPAKPVADLPVGPGVIASSDELAKPWSSKSFLFRDAITGTEVPALVVRLPRGGYWGFSLREPFGTCQFEFVSDLQKLSSEYGFAADHPMVGDPCNHSVYDLLQWGGPSDAEVRGAPVHGMGVRPPLAIEIEQQGKQVLALKME
jgi:hypothetical protein